MPRVAWQFEEDTPMLDSKEFYQGAYMKYGQGKIVVMGEAAMFTAQLADPSQNRVGMNRPEAQQKLPTSAQHCPLARSMKNP